MTDKRLVLWRRGPMGPVTTYVTTIALIGAIALAVVAGVSGSPTRPSDAILPLTLIGVLSVLVPLRYQHGHGTQGFILDEGVLLAMLFALSGPLPAILMTASTVAAHLVLRTRAVKLAFNAGQMAMASTAGLAVFRLIGPGPDVLETRSVLAAVAAAVAHNAVSSLALAGLFQRLDGRSIQDTLTSVWRTNAITLVGNTSFGLVLAVLAGVNPAATVLASTLLIGLYLGYRGYVSQLDERRRADELQMFTHSLLNAPGSGFGPWHEQALGRVARMLGARSVVLSLAGGDRRLVTYATEEAADHAAAAGRLHEEACRLRVAFSISDPADHELLGAADATDALVAPVFRGEDVAGSLMVFGRHGLEPWGDNHLTLLATMATELSVMLENMALFRQVEEERGRLEAETGKLSDILGAASDGIVSILPDGTIEAWNPGIARITGVPSDDAMGRPWDQVLRLRADDNRELTGGSDHAITRALVGHVWPDSLQLQALRRDGSWRRVASRASLVRGPGDRIEGLVLMVRDVTAERELEALKSEFIATVSHELRTPLTPLTGFLGTLRAQGSSLSEDQLATIHEAMGKQLVRLETLIGDLLAVAELDHGDFEVDPRPIEVGEVVRAAVLSEDPDERDRVTVAEESCTAMADPIALVRVVRSLVSNALKHTAGPVGVRIDTVDDLVAIAVADRGPGIASWEMQRIFRRFERLGDHLTRTQGPGLGLTIARSLARRMGGDVTVASELGVGSTFVLTLPRARPRAVSEPAPVDDATA